MPAFSGHAGLATFIRPAGGVVLNRYTAGITAWHVRLSVESTGLLFTRPAYPAGVAEVPLLKEVFVGGQNADVTLSGHMSDEESPFEDFSSLLVPQPGNYALFLLEYAEPPAVGPSMSASGRIVSVEVTSAVRGVISFQMRAALDQLRMT